MDIAWHERLIERLIKNSKGDATIKDYFSIVDQNEKSQLDLIKKAERELMDTTMDQGCTEGNFINENN